MRTTIRLDDELLRQIKERSAQTGRTMGQLIEDAVRESLGRVEFDEHEVPPLPVFGGSGLMPGVNIASTSELIDAMDEGESLDELR